MGTMIELKTADGTAVPAYEARPAGKPRGAVVVIQEIFGVNSHIRNVADAYAAEGYLAVAPAAFHRVKPGVELGYSEADMGEGFGYKTAVEALPAPGVMQDIQAAIDHAAKACGGKVGVVGYCWGGAADLALGLPAVRPECGSALLRRWCDHARRNRTPAQGAGAGALCRRRQVDSAGHGAGLCQSTPGSGSAHLRGAPRLQLRPARRLARTLGEAGTRTHAGVFREARRLSCCRCRSAPACE